MLNWGSIPDWFAAIGTVGALFLGFGILLRERAHSRRAAADAFVTWENRALTFRYPETTKKKRTGRDVPKEDHESVFLIWLESYNSGSSPVIDPGLNSPNDGPHPLSESLVGESHAFTKVSPGEQTYRQIAVTVPALDVGLLVISFTDGSGHRWHRMLKTNRYISDRKYRRMMKHPNWYANKKVSPANIELSLR